MVNEFTKEYPQDEMFGLVSQIRRAAISITSNIAEDFGRRTITDKIRFYYIAAGSITEIHNQALISKDLEYITDELFQEIMKQTESVYKLLNASIRKSKSFENKTF